MRKKVMGFTLIELMIVVAIIAIIAAIAIPGLLRARISANEGSASAGLRSIASAQANFSKSQTVDQDTDGSGENGVFNELTGSTSCRGVSGGAQRPALKVTDLTVALQATAGNFSAKSGYYFQMFLPGSVGAIVTDNGTAELNPLDPAIGPEAAAIQQQEQLWLCYGWPATYRSSGIRAFVSNQSADVFATANTDVNNAGYFFGDGGGGGLANRPVYSTAMVNDGTVVIDEATWTNISVKDNVNAADPNHVWVPSSS